MNQTVNTYYQNSTLHIFCQLFILLSFSQTLQSQTKYTISGNITDAGNGEALVGATIFDSNSKQGTACNAYGFYSLTLEKGQVQIETRFVGYENGENTFLLNRDTVLNIALKANLMLEEIVIDGTIPESIERSARTSVIHIPIKQINSVPPLLGEVDLMKALQLLPGVQSGGEGTSGLYVRGGSPDQNLILLDGVQVYNANHLFGFMSVFNTDAIKNVEMVKGGFPARYGGRLSSVVDITMKEGNNQKLSGKGSINWISSKFTLEGPIKKNESSFIISARRSYVDLISRIVLKAQSDGDDTGGYFLQDINAKINQKLGEKDRIYLSVYTGKDKGFIRHDYTRRNSDNDLVTATQEASLTWGNITSALRWNHVISNQLFANTSLTYSQYQFKFFADEREKGATDVPPFLQYKFLSNIRDYSAKLDLDYLPSPKHYIRAGSQIIQHSFDPGVSAVSTQTVIDTTFGKRNIRAVELMLYAEDEFQLHKRLSVNLGVHASGFQIGETTYRSFQPRVSIRYLLADLFAIKASYASMTQYIHLLSNTGIGLPTDLWVPATERVKPQDAEQLVFGLGKELSNQFEVSIEGYYKEMQNLIEYSEGATFLSQYETWENKVEVGKGKSYGLEFFVQKKIGRITGWLGYTLSKTDRTFQNIDEGRTFPYRYDRRHDISVTGTYKLNQKWEMSMAWVFGSGQWVTLPYSKYSNISIINDLITFGSAGGDLFTNNYNYERRNSFQMRPYHRMDISISKKKVKKNGVATWNFGLYNAYNRRNPYYIYLDDGQSPKFKQVSFSFIIPFVTYSFEF